MPTPRSRRTQRATLSLALTAATLTLAVTACNSGTNGATTTNPPPTTCTTNPATTYWNTLWNNTPPTGINVTALGADCTLTTTEKALLNYEQQLARDPYYTTHQIQSINDRFGDEPGIDVLNAVKAYYTKAKTYNLTNFDATLVTGFKWFFGDDYNFPQTDSDPPHTGLQPSAGFEGVGYLDLHANDLPADGSIPPSYTLLTSISTEEPSWEPCKYTAEWGKRNTSPTATFDRNYAVTHYNDNVPVRAPAYGNMVIDDLIFENYGGNPATPQITVGIKYTPTETLFDASEVYFQVTHLMWKDGKTDPASYPLHIGDKITENTVIGYLNTYLSDYVGGGLGTPHPYDVIDFLSLAPIQDATANNLQGYVSVVNKQWIRLFNWKYDQTLPMNLQFLENDPRLIRYDNPQLTGTPDRTALSPCAYSWDPTTGTSTPLNIP